MPCSAPSPSGSSEKPLARCSRSAIGRDARIVGLIPRGVPGDGRPVGMVADLLLRASRGLLAGRPLGGADPPGGRPRRGVARGLLSDSAILGRETDTSQPHETPRETAAEYARPTC